MQGIETPRYDADLIVKDERELPSFTQHDLIYAPPEKVVKMVEMLARGRARLMAL